MLPQLVVQRPGRLAEQDRQTIERRLETDLQRGNRRAGLGQVLLRLRDIQGRRESRVEPVVRQFEAVLLGRDVLSGEIESCLERPGVHVRRADLRVEGDEDVTVVLHGSLELRIRCLDGAPDAPEQVDLPAQADSGGPGIERLAERRAGSVVRLTCLGALEPVLAQLLVAVRPAERDVGPVLTRGDTTNRTSLGHASDGRLEIEVPELGTPDQLGQHGIVERDPPHFEVRGICIHLGLDRRAPLVGDRLDREVGRLVVGTHRASGGQQGKRDEQPRDARNRPVHRSTCRLESPLTEAASTSVAGAQASGAVGPLLRFSGRIGGPAPKQRAGGRRR